MEISLNKTSSAELDQSFAHLQELLYKGYTTVKWNLSTSESCEICKWLSEKFKNGVDLANFLGFKRHPKFQKDENGNDVPVLDENGHQVCDFEKMVDIYREAPIYNWAHVGCNCSVTVFDNKYGQPSELVSNKG